METSVDAGSKAANIASYVLFGRVITFAMVGLAFILVTRLLGPTQYGVYTLAVAFAGIFGSVGYLGIGTTLNKFISEYKEKNNSEAISVLFSNAMVLVLLWGIGLTLLCFLLSNFISVYLFHSSLAQYVIVVQVVSFWIIAVMLFGAIYDSLLGFGNGKNIAIVASVQAFFQAGISIVLALMGFEALAPIYGIVFGYFIGFAVGVTIMFKHNKMRLYKPSFEQIKKLLGFSVPVASAGIFSSVVGSLGLVILGYFALPAVIGNVGIAARTSSLMSIIFDSISFAILPTFSAVMVNKKLGKEIGKIYGSTVYFAILIVSPLLFYMAILSTPFSYTLFGSTYTDGPLYISIASVGLLLGLAGAYANTLLVSLGKVKLVFGYTFITYFAALIMYLVFIPVFGGNGYAIITFIILPIMVDIIFINELRRTMKVDFKMRKLMGIIGANVVAVLLVLPLYLLFSGIPLLILAAIAFIIIYPPVAVATGGARREDIETLKTLSKEVPLVGRVLALFADYASMVIR